MASTPVSEKFALLTANGTADGIVTIPSNKGWLPGCTVWLNANGKNPAQCVIATQIGTTQIQLRHLSGGFLNLSTYTVAGGSNLSLEQQVVQVKFFRNGAKSTTTTPAPELAPAPVISTATFSNGVLTISGSSFVSGAVASVDGVNKTTTFVSATSLSADITGTEAGTYTVTVTNPDTQTSNSYSFSVVYVRDVTAPPSLPPGGVTTTSDHWFVLLNTSSAYNLSSDMAIDGSGSIYSAGYYNTFDQNGNQTGFGYSLAKVNSSTQHEWTKTAGGGFLTQSAALTRALNGDLYVAGATGGTEEIAVLKYDTYGNLKWHAGMGASSTDYPSGITSDIYGNCYVSSTCQGLGFVILKYNQAGVLQWQKRLGSNGNQSATGIAIDNNENIYTIGTFLGGGVAGTNSFIAKYNPTTGTVVWQKGLGSTGDDYYDDIVIDSSNNAYVVGRTSTTTTSLLVAKYSSTGTLLWQKYLLPNSGNINYTSTCIDTNNNIYVSCTWFKDNNNSLGFVAKYNSSGALLWQRLIRNTVSPTDMYVKKVANDGVGNYYLSGYAKLPSLSSYTQTILAKLPTDGTKTGTYSSFEYSTGSWTEQVLTLGELTTGLSQSNASLSQKTYTVAEGTLSASTSRFDV